MEIKGNSNIYLKNTFGKNVQNKIAKFRITVNCKVKYAHDILKISRANGCATELRKLCRLFVRKGR